MDKYQVFEVAGEFNHAGTKATEDIMTVAEKLGFEKLVLKMRSARTGYVAKAQRQMGYFIDWSRCYEAITDGAVVLLQHPFHYPQITREKNLFALKNKKHVKFISVIHDVEELRAFRFNDYYKREFEVMLEISDVIIVHNSVMKSFFLERGVSEDKMVILEIFDYLQDENTEKNIRFEKSLSIAGNLDITKCRYISQLGQIRNIKINLYGPNFNEKMRDIENIEYHGSFPVEKIPDQLKAGFGLVWDGDSIDGCKGLSGQYLRYNNPHKLSLYLSSGMPVVIWSGAAEAEFVRKNKVGICVESLFELDNIFAHMTQQDFEEMENNTKRLSCKLKKGDYARRALKEALDIINCNENI